jgi:hypothetical protein
VGFSFSVEAQARGLALLVAHIARACGVNTDEVALLVLDRRGENLHFIAPEYLVRLNAVIPFKPELSLAGRCLSERRIEIENRLSAVNHLSHFERARRMNPRPLRLEKMMSIPVCYGSVPVGVVQVSRKRIPGSAPGADFRLEDALHVVEIERKICRLLQGVRATVFAADPTLLAPRSEAPPQPSAAISAKKPTGLARVIPLVHRI